MRSLPWLRELGDEVADAVLEVEHVLLVELVDHHRRDRLRGGEDVEGRLGA